MKARSQLSPDLLQLARAQAQTLTLEQAAAFGFGRYAVDRMIRSGQWNRLARGLISLVPEPSWLGWAWGGVLLGGDHARLGGSAAAFLHGLESQEPGLITVKVPLGRQVGARFRWTFEREQEGVRRSGPGEPPRLSVEDTVLDRCSGVSEGDVIGLVTHAVQTRRTTPERLRRRLAERPRVSHRKIIEQLIEDVAAGAESPLERGYLTGVERPHRLPTGRRQARSRDGHVRDVRYDEYGVLVELDGRVGHEGMGRFRDMNRDNLAAVSGEVTLRYGHRDVFGRPCEVTRQVAAVLIRRGWPGLPTRCVHCRAIPEDHFRSWL